MPTGITSIVKDIKNKQIGKPGQNYQGEHSGGDEVLIH
jgi:hypothetical protein